MTAASQTEYRKLALDSSNYLMEWDGTWCLGHYEQATYAVLQAGEMRRRMVQLSLDEGNFERAAANALSSSACFVHATMVERAREALAVAEQLAAEGRIGPARRDIFVALRERQQEVAKLDEKVRAWIATHGDAAAMHALPTVDRLAALRKQIGELPGLDVLHLEIYRLATALGQPELARQHLEWSRKFAANERERLTCDVANGVELSGAGDLTKR